MDFEGLAERAPLVDHRGEGCAVTLGGVKEGAGLAAFEQPTPQVEVEQPAERSTLEPVADLDLAAGRHAALEGCEEQNRASSR